MLPVWVSQGHSSINSVCSFGRTTEAGGDSGWWRSVWKDHTSPSFAPTHTSAGNVRSFKTSQVEEADVREDVYAGLWPVLVGV